MFFSGDELMKKKNSSVYFIILILIALTMFVFIKISEKNSEKKTTVNQTNSIVLGLDKNILLLIIQSIIVSGSLGFLIGHSIGKRKTKQTDKDTVKTEFLCPVCKEKFLTKINKNSHSDMKTNC
jgi:hypothetical protein